MANGSFGIEHPLVTVRDIASTAAFYEHLGFAPTPLGRHPWGTVNRLIMFPDNFIELISIADPAAIEADPVGGHRFGRLVQASLAQAEGISLMALHSADAAADEAMALERGAVSNGRVDFRRAVRLPDGTADEAVVSLIVLPDAPNPNLSFFLCQQHKPHLVWNPDWLRHPNGAEAITSVTYLAPEPATVADRFRAVWGELAIRPAAHGFSVTTAGGEIHVLDNAGVAAHFPGLPLPDGAEQRAPCGVGISVRSATPEAALRLAATAGARIAGNRALVPPALAGNVMLEIHG